MAKSNSFNKREIEKNKQQKRKEKQQKREERKNSSTDSFEDMIAYVDENGVITDTPPDTQRQKVNVENIEISTPKREDIEDPVLNGRVEYFNEDKNYGFIKHTGSTDKYFFHVSNAPSNITEGNMVTFELERGQKGMNAVRIALVNKENAQNNKI